MNEEKQIEEMTDTISASRFHNTSKRIAETLYNASYRKQSEGEWVSVEEDGLPREDGEYLTFNRLVYFVLEFNSSLQLWNVSAWNVSTAIRDVTHWMPLPKPPKMKGE